MEQSSTSVSALLAISGVTDGVISQNRYKCTGFGNLKFGHLTFIVLTGILARDLFPDPGVVCQFLNGNQWHAIT